MGESDFETSGILGAGDVVAACESIVYGQHPGDISLTDFISSIKPIWLALAADSKLIDKIVSGQTGEFLVRVLNIGFAVQKQAGLDLRFLQDVQVRSTDLEKTTLVKTTRINQYGTVIVARPEDEAVTKVSQCKTAQNVSFTEASFRFRVRMPG